MFDSGLYLGPSGVAEYVYCVGFVFVLRVQLSRITLFKGLQVVEREDEQKHQEVGESFLKYTRVRQECPHSA